MISHCGQCKDFPCEQLKRFAYDEKQGDGGQRLCQCKRWLEEDREQLARLASQL